MRTYSPNGLGHMALARLSEGPATLDDLREAMGCTDNSKPRKAWYAINALLGDRLAWKSQGDHGITRAGFAALERLKAGEAVTFAEPLAVPSYQVFDAARDRGEPNTSPRRAA